MLKNFPLKTGQVWCSAVLGLAMGMVGSNCPSLRAATIAQSGANKPKVLATSTVVCDVARQTAQDTIDLKCLIDAGSDPHLYQPKPADRADIEQAKLILYAGYDFEPQLIKLIKATSNPAPKIAVDEVAVPKPQQFEDDGKQVNDPHVFHNAANGAQIAQVIGKSLSQLQPNSAELYTKNTKKIADELTSIHSWIKSQIGTIPTAQRKLVTTHDAFGYYSTAYAIPVAGALQGISTEEQATAKRVAELVKSIKEAGVPTIFAEATINPRLIQAVGREAKVKVSDRELFADGIGEKGSEGDTYQKLLMANTRTIVEELGGKYTAFRGSSAILPSKVGTIQALELVGKQKR